MAKDKPLPLGLALLKELAAGSAGVHCEMQLSRPEISQPDDAAGEGRGVTPAGIYAKTLVVREG